MERDFRAFAPYLGLLLFIIVVVLLSLGGPSNPEMAKDRAIKNPPTDPINFPETSGDLDKQDTPSSPQHTRPSPSLPEKSQPSADGKKLSEEKSVVSERGKTLFQGKWGQAEGEFGISEDGPRPGPMSFVVDKKGHTWVLDQENQRIQIFDQKGKVLRIIPLPSHHYQLLTLDGSTSRLALYNVQDRQIEVFSPLGNELAEHKIPADMGPVSEIWLRGDQVYVETKHNQIYRYSPLQEGPQLFPGRPTGKDGALKVRRVDGKSVELKYYRISADGSSSLVWKKNLPVVSSNIEALQTDSRGNIYLGWRQYAETMDGQGKRTVIVDEKKIMKLNSQGTYIGDVQLSPLAYTDYRRGIYISPSGDVYQMISSSKKMRIASFSIQR